MKQIYRELEVVWERVLVVSGAVDVNELKSLDPKSGENGDTSPTQARHSAPGSRRGGFRKIYGESKGTGPNAKDQGVKAFWKTYLGGGNSNIFWNFHPENLGKMNPFWRAYFSNGLVKNHQPVLLRDY